MNKNLTIALFTTIGIIIGIFGAQVFHHQPSPDFLFVQHAEGGNFTQAGESIMLNLTGVSPSTSIFSNRPNRQVLHGKTADFVDDWNTGDDSFHDDPPNATLSIADTGEIIVVELLKPEYNEQTRTLSYEVKSLSGKEIFNFDSEEQKELRLENLPKSFSSSSLFIDDLIFSGKITIHNKTSMNTSFQASWAGMGIGGCQAGPGGSCSIKTKSACYDVSGGEDYGAVHILSSICTAANVVHELIFDGNLHDK